VCFVDHEQADGARQQALEEVSILEALRREIKNFLTAGLDTVREVACLRVGEVRVHRERVDPARGELVLLILHQRDERAHDDGEPGEHQRRELVDERLPAPRRHDDERVVPLEHRADRLPLAFLEFAMAESLDEYATSLGLK
jgi:hypothetical protein